MASWVARTGARPAPGALRNNARCQDAASPRTGLARLAVGTARGTSLCPRPIAGAPVSLQQDGTVPNTAKIDKVPPHVLPLLQGIVAASAAQHGDSLVGVYLRGSLPQGHYIDGMSDVDTFCIVLSDPTTAAPHSSSPGRPSLRETLLAEGHQPHLVATVEAVVHEVGRGSCLGHALARLKSTTPPVHLPAQPPGAHPTGGLPETGPAEAASRSFLLAAGGGPEQLPAALLKELPCAFLLRSQSVCLHGLDLPQLLPPAAGLPPPPTLGRLGEGVEAALATARHQGSSQEDAAVALRWALKACLRMAGSLAMPPLRVHSRDLYWCCHLAAQQLPRLEPLLRQALQLYLDLHSNPDQAGLDEAEGVVEALRGALYRVFLRQMLTPEPDWLPHHYPQGAVPAGQASTGTSLLERLGGLGQLLVGASKPPAIEELLGGVAPRINVRITGPVGSYSWHSAKERSVACDLIRRWSLPTDAQLTPEAARQLLSSRPIVVRGAAAGWPAVGEWSVRWLEGQGFEGKVKVAPSLQFPFCEPSLLELLVQAKGPSAAPSSDVQMSVAEFVARMSPGPRPPPLIYPQREYYYMQAELTPQLLAMTHLHLPPFVAAPSDQFEVGEASCDERGAGPEGPGVGGAGEGRAVAQVPRLWLSGGGSVSPLHYDESHSFLAQLRVHPLQCPSGQHGHMLQVQGAKRMLFWPPGDLPRLYPYPPEHLLRRRSRVNLARPDLDRFPLFQGAGAVEVVLHPGDVVFFPARWAHYTESLGASVSITCRHRSGAEEADAAE